MQYQWSRLYHVDDEGGLVDCDIYDGDYRNDGSCIFVLNWATTFLGTFDFGRLVIFLHDIKYSIKCSLYRSTIVRCWW